jgi:hypothetical protein
MSSENQNTVDRAYLSKVIQSFRDVAFTLPSGTGTNDECNNDCDSDKDIISSKINDFVLELALTDKNIICNSESKKTIISSVALYLDLLDYAISVKSHNSTIDSDTTKVIFTVSFLTIQLAGIAVFNKGVSIVDCPYFNTINSMCNTFTYKVINEERFIKAISKLEYLYGLTPYQDYYDNEKLFTQSTDSDGLVDYIKVLNDHRVANHIAGINNTLVDDVVKICLDIFADKYTHTTLYLPIIRLVVKYMRCGFIGNKDDIEMNLILEQFITTTEYCINNAATDADSRLVSQQLTDIVEQQIVPMLNTWSLSSY